MMQEETKRLVGNFVAIVFAIFFTWPANSLAWNHDKAWLENQLKGSSTPLGIDSKSYIGKVRDRSRSKWDSNNDNQADPGSGSLSTYPGLGNREYWQGDWDSVLPPAVLESSLNYFDDMMTNFTDGFNDCLDFQIDIDWDVFDIDISLELWWPVYQVHTHPIFQNRYGDIFQIIINVASYFGVNLSPTGWGYVPQEYPLLFELDAHAWTPYTVAGYPVPHVSAYAPFQYLITPMQMGHAKFNMQHDLFEKYGPLAAVLTAAGMDTSWIFPEPALYAAPAADKQLRYSPFNPYNAKFYETVTSPALSDLELDHFNPLGDDGSQREFRYTTTQVSGRHPLEFSVLPSLFTLIWQYIPVINTLFNILPSGCKPPRRIAYPWDSDRMEMFYHTRDPFSSKMTFTEDTAFQADYNRWLEDPKSCTEYKMRNSSSYGYIPFNQFDSAITLPLLPSINLPDLVSPNDLNGSPSSYNRMCTSGVGTNVPPTIHNAPQGVEVLAALENIEKASRLSYAYYRKNIQYNSSVNWLYTFRMIDESRDKIQFTYHDNMDKHQCYRFGEMHQLFNNANSYTKKGDYGLYNATIWQRASCHLSWWQIVAIPLMLVALVGVLGPLVIIFS